MEGEQCDSDPFSFTMGGDNGNFILNFEEEDSGRATDNSYPEKRRRVDEDGFVTPATPDIPKTSVQYPHDRYKEDGSDQYSHERHKDTGNDDTTQYVEDDSCTVYYQQSGGDDNDTPQVHETENAPSSASPLCHDVGGGGDGQHEVISIPDDDKDADITTLLTRLVQEASAVHMNWANPLSESEQFELTCSKQLDSILEKAKEHEQNLIQQKETLRQRLQALSRTLQLL